MAIGEPNTIFTKNLKGIKRRLSFSIIVLLIALILIILSLFLPWWSANFIHQSRHSSGIPNEDRDYNINFHLTETILENNYDKGTKDHIPHEKSDELETDYPDHLKNIFYMVISLIILAIVAFIFLLRFRFTLKNYWLIIALLIPIIIISFVTIFLFSGYTTDDNHVSDLWGESSVEIKYDSFQMSYQPGFGFFLIIIAAVYIMISLVSFLSIIFSANRRMIIKAHHPTKVNIRITQVSGIIIMVLVLFLLYFSFNTPWWTCNYSGEIDYPEDVTSIDFGWGPDKAYLIVEQGDTNELSPFDGHTYSEKSVHSEEFFSGDFKEGPPRGLIYEREKEVVSNTAYLVYIAMGMVLFSENTYKMDHYNEFSDCHYDHYSIAIFINSIAPSVSR